MFATFQLDRTGLRNLAAIGDQNIMWGSDFPHPDGTWPDSQKILDRQFEGISTVSRRRILFENAAKLYGFPDASTGNQPTAS